MKKINIYIESKASGIAEVTGIVLRENETFRIVFSTKVVDNPNNKNDDLRATFYVQRKSALQKWEDLNTLRLQDLKSNEWIKLDLKSGELSLLLEFCNQLKQKYREEGKQYFFDTTRVLLVDSDREANDISNIINFINDNPEGKKLINSISKVTNQKVVDFLNEDINNLVETIDKLSIESNEKIYNILLSKVINPKYIEDNMNESREEFWQELFKKHPLIISTICPSLLHLISDKPYYGGKAISNNGGVLGDYIYELGINNVCIVEIKTPCSKLMSNNPYRNTVYSISEELSGAIVQIRKQKDAFMKEYMINHFNSSLQGINYSAYDPKTILIVGNTQSLNAIQLESFELFRRELKDIEIITYDELIKKLTFLINSLNV